MKVCSWFLIVVRGQSQTAARQATIKPCPGQLSPAQLIHMQAAGTERARTAGYCQLQSWPGVVLLGHHGQHACIAAACPSPSPPATHLQSAAAPWQPPPAVWYLRSVCSI